MDINVLTINIGNSRVASGAFLAGELGAVARAPVADRVAIQEAVARGWERLDANGAVVAVSVNPAANEAIEHIVEQVTGRDIVWVGRRIELPIKVLTDQPEQTGMDRVLNIAAAHEQLEAACVVVDAGTALTVDLCNDDGDFIGGAILPGASMMLEALHDRIPRLPRVSLKAPVAGVGSSTEEAIRGGVYHGIRGAVKELVEAYALKLGRWPEVIATGGDASVLFEGWELIHAIAPDLTLYGIALAYTEHHLKHE